MFSLFSLASLRHRALGLASCLIVFGTATAQENAAPQNPAPATQNAPRPFPPPDPAAEKALHQHFQAIHAALEGKAAVPDAKNFTEDFNQQVDASQLKQVFEQVHQKVGNCRIAGQLKAPVSFISSYLLQCDNGFVPIDIAIEDKPPYRVHSLLIRPGYAKL